MYIFCSLEFSYATKGLFHKLLFLFSAKNGNTVSFSFQFCAKNEILVMALISFSVGNALPSFSRSLNKTILFITIEQHLLV